MWYEKSLKALGIVEVTTWSTLNTGYMHNHIELGHNKNKVPVGNPEQTKVWKNQKWSKRFTYGKYINNCLILDK